MGENGLTEAIRKGAPLLEVTVQFVDGVDYGEVTNLLNGLADDFHLTPKPWYGRPELRVGFATKEALERLFGWRFKRVPIAGHSEFYCWAEVSPVQRYPVPGVIRSIGVSQPGSNDDGQWHEQP